MQRNTEWRTLVLPVLALKIDFCPQVYLSLLLAGPSHCRSLLSCWIISA